MKTIFMPKRLWKKWDKALRSGGYDQATRTLYHPETMSFCCLGVLQHCTDKGNVEVSENNGEYLAIPTKKWLREMGIKFKDKGGRVENDPFLPLFAEFATSANDYGKTFPEIADAIADCVQFTDAKP